MHQGVKESGGRVRLSLCEQNEIGRRRPDCRSFCHATIKRVAHDRTHVRKARALEHFSRNVGATKARDDELEL